MESAARTVAGTRSARVIRWCAVALSFATLALLNGRAIDSRAGFVSAYTACMLAFALLALVGIGGLVYACNRGARASGGFPAVLDAVAGGFAFMLPFALLALVAELLLDWNAAQVFTQAGIMVCGTMAAADVVRMSGGRMAQVIPPVAGSFLFSFLWMLLSAASQAMVG